MRLQRELPEYCSRGHARYSHSWITATTQRLSGPTFSATIFRRLDESACNSKPKNLSQGKRNLFVCNAQRFGEPQHHRGQLMLIERMLGIVPHLTRQMQERMAAVSSGPAR
jgi:hypothetical protein